MAHNLNFNKQTGKYNYFSVKEKAWYGLGQIVQDYPNSKEALQFAGLDFEVCKRPNIHRLDNGNEIISTNSFYTYRPDTNAILGDRLGKDYEVVQNTDAFSFFDAIVDGNDVSNAKPDPEVFLRAAKLVGVSNENSIVFEDSVAGIQAANIANMISIGIGDETVLYEAKYNFKDFTFIDETFLEQLICPLTPKGGI